MLTKENSQLKRELENRASTTDDLEETKERTLSFSDQFNSHVCWRFITSKLIVAKLDEDKIMSPISIPARGNVENFQKQNLTITQVQWNRDKGIFEFGLSLNDGQNLKIGEGPFTNSHTFDPKKDITRIEHIFGDYDDRSWNIYHIDKPYKFEKD